jgi:hypothetical protein
VPVGDVEGIDWADFEDKVDLAIGEVDVAQENGVATVTAEVAGAEEGTTATVTITPDAMYTDEVIAEYEEANELIAGSIKALLTQEVAVEDGKVVATFSPLLPGTHTVTVAIGDVNRSADFTVEAEEAPGELVVESVKAINDTLKQAPDQQLKIQINGSQEVTVEELTEAGYTVKFLFNKSITGLSPAAQEAARENGVIDTSNTPFYAEFKYAVQVTDAEGNLIPETVLADAYATVTVLNAATVTEVTGVKLSTELAYVTVNDKASIQLVSALNAFGEEVEGVTLKDLKATIKSSDVTVAYAKDLELVIRKAGTVTLTVEFPKELKIAPVTLTVEVKAAQIATSIEAKDLKVETADGDDYAYKFEVLDQYGEALRTSGPSFVVETTDVDGEVVDTFAKVGKYTVTVYLEKTVTDSDGEITLEKGTKLGSYKVETVDVAEGEVDTFEFSTDKDFLLDLNGDAFNEDVNNATVALKGFIEGVELTTLENRLADYKLVSSNETVFTVEGPEDLITVTAKAVGTETLSLVKVEGDIVTVVASIELTVKNTTPQITTLTLKDDAKAIDFKESDDQEALKVAVAEQVKTNLEADITPSQIAKVELTSQGTVIITIKDVNGGKEFVLPVNIIDDAPPTITSATIGDVTVTPADGELSFVLDADTIYDATTSTIAFSENIVEAIVTYANAEYPIATVDMAGLLAAFAEAGGDGNSIKGSTLINVVENFSVEIFNAAGNSTVYTIKFEEAAPAQ